MNNETEHTDRSRITGKHIGIAALVMAVVLVFVSQANKKTDEDDTPASPSTGIEFCAVLRDPENAGLTSGDFRRMGEWTQSEMMVYVARHCPDQKDRVKR